MAKAKKKDFRAIYEAVPGRRTVTATGGALTNTALDMACRILEKSGKSVKEIIASDYGLFAAPWSWTKKRISSMQSKKSVRLTWKSMVFRSQSYDRDMKPVGDKLEYSPKRSFTLRACPDLPPGAILLIPNKGRAARVVVSE